MTFALTIALLLLATVAVALWRVDLSRRRLRAELSAVRAHVGQADALQRRCTGLERRLTEERSRSTELASQLTELGRTNAELPGTVEYAVRELREPLAKVISFCQLLQNRRYADRMDYRARQYLGFALDAALRAQSLLGHGSRDVPGNANVTDLLE